MKRASLRPLVDLFWPKYQPAKPEHYVKAQMALMESLRLVQKFDGYVFLRPGEVEAVRALLAELPRRPEYRKLAQQVPVELRPNFRGSSGSRG